MNIAIIPARGGSKRIPRKNIKSFFGVPIIAYAIKVAKESQLFDEIVVSTDDSEIAEIAVSFGASVPWIRDSQLSDDFASTVSVMQDAVERLDSNVRNIDNFCCVYPTTPLLRSVDLQGGLIKLNEGDWEYVVAATRSKTPIERFLTIGKNHEIHMRFPEHETSRTQDLPPAFSDAGQFYWGKKTSWKAGRPLFSSRSTILEIPQQYAVDVDTTEDWHYAELMYSLFQRGAN